MNDSTVSFVSLDQVSAETREQVRGVLDSAFGDNQFFSNTQACFFSGYISERPNAVLVWSGSTLAGIAIVGARKIRLAGGGLEAITIGPLAVRPVFQGKGFGRMILSGIETLAKELGATVGYLQGAPGFYKQFGYFPFLARSKLVVSLESVKRFGDVSSEDLTFAHRGPVKRIYDAESSKFTCTAVRSESDWNWLTKYASKSYYFYQPQVVLRRGEMIGYFASDPREPGRIREAVYSSRPENVSAFVSAVADYVRARGAASLELMTPPGTAIHDYAKASLDATFTQLIQRNRGQLMKVYDVDKVFSMLSPGFDGRSDRISSSIGMGALRKSDTENMPVAALEELPGLLSGYIDLAYSRGPADSRKWFADISNNTQQFIFQGDNF